MNPDMGAVLLLLVVLMIAFECEISTLWERVKELEKKLRQPQPNEWDAPVGWGSEEYDD
jgi:hypothetical protein